MVVGRRPSLALPCQFNQQSTRVMGIAATMNQYLQEVEVVAGSK